MWQKLQQNKNWQYSTQVWYNKYHTAIEIGYQSRYHPIRLPPCTDLDVSFRSRQRYTKKGIITTVYTDSVEYAQKVIDFYKNKIISVRSPINQEHLDILLDGETKVDIREIFGINAALKLMSG